MKLSAMLDRQKGRDFYDVMFMLSHTMPDFNFLSQKKGISNPESLKAAIGQSIQNVDLKHKMRDFEHLLFNPAYSSMILHIPAFFESLNLEKSNHSK